MKCKLYLSLVVMLCAFLSQSSLAQPVLNEIYTSPNGSCNATPRTEFFEIYNGNQGGGNAVANLGCYYVITRWQNGGGGANNEGFYVIDLPLSAVTNSAGFFTAAPTLTAATQTQNSFPCEFTPSLNWNTSGITTKYTWNGATYTSAPEINLTNFFDENANAMYVFLFNGSTLSDALIAGGGGNTAGIMSTVNGWPTLPVSVNCLGTLSIQNINFSSISAAEIDFVNQNAGSNNGFARDHDGNCGGWNKTSSPPYHTPNASNPGTIANTETYWNVSYTIPVIVTPSLYTVDATLTSIQNAGLISVTVYRDINNNSTYDVGIDPQTYSTSITASGNTATINGIQLIAGATSFVLLRADNNCYYTQNKFTTASGPLPLKLKSFTATKSVNGASLNWETSFESNAASIDVERKVGNDYVTIVSIPATNIANGSKYTYQDIISIKDLNFYRLKLVDKDGKYQYSEIRTVRGSSSTIAFVISPNPAYGSTVVSLSDISNIDELQVIDLSGRVLQKLPVTSNKVQLNNIPKGTYLVRVSDKKTGESLVQKLSIL